MSAMRDTSTALPPVALRKGYVFRTFDVVRLRAAPGTATNRDSICWLPVHTARGDGSLPVHTARGDGWLAEALPNETRLLERVAPQSTEGDGAAALWGQIKAAAEEANVAAALLASLVWAESSGNPGARSGVGAMGLSQIMPTTWAEWAGRVGASDPWDAGDNLRVGAAYLAWLLDRLGGDVERALWAYNWGIGNVLGGGEPPAETRLYAAKIRHAADVMAWVSAAGGG